MASDTASSLTSLYRDGALERIYGSLLRQVPGASREDVQDAVAAAVLACLSVRVGEQPDDPAAYLFIAAKRELQRILAKSGRLPVDSRNPDGWSGKGDAPDQGVDFGDLLRFVKRLISRWDNQRMRAIIEMVLESAVEGVELRGEQLKQQVEDAIGETISTSTFYDLKNRGLRRLRLDLECELERIEQKEDYNE